MNALNSQPVLGASNASSNGSTINDQQPLKNIVWSSCDAAAAATASSSETLLNHMRNTLLNRQAIAPSSSQHAVNPFANTHNLSCFTGNPFLPGLSTQVNSQLGSFAAGLPTINPNGNIFDHPLIKNTALQPTPIREHVSSSSGGGHMGTLSLLDESLEALLNDKSFGLGSDDPSPLLFHDPAAFVFSKGSLDSKRMCPTNGQLMPDAKRQRFDNSGQTSSCGPKFRPYQEKQWQEQFEELLKFKEKNGNCLVPHSFEENQALSRWVKRQRYQYKLMQENKVTTMTQSRVVQLEEVGFIWDSHAAAWQERLAELEDYRKSNGNSHVPSNYPEKPQLATWVKCQRRQGKLYFNGRPSNMTKERVEALNRLGFSWGMRHGF